MLKLYYLTIINNSYINKIDKFFIKINQNMYFSMILTSIPTILSVDFLFFAHEYENKAMNNCLFASDNLAAV